MPALTHLERELIERNRLLLRALRREPVSVAPDGVPLFFVPAPVVEGRAIRSTGPVAMTRVPSGTPLYTEERA